MFFFATSSASAGTHRANSVRYNLEALNNEFDKKIQALKESKKSEEEAWQACKKSKEEARKEYQEHIDSMASKLFWGTIGSIVCGSAVALQGGIIIGLGAYGTAVTLLLYTLNVSAQQKPGNSDKSLEREQAL